MFISPRASGVFIQPRNAKRSEGGFGYPDMSRI